MSIKTKGQLSADLASILTDSGLLTANEDRLLRQNPYDSLAALLGNNSFVGNQDINGNLDVSGTVEFGTDFQWVNANGLKILKHLSVGNDSTPITPRALYVTETFNVNSFYYPLSCQTAHTGLGNSYIGFSNTMVNQQITSGTSSSIGIENVIVYDSALNVASKSFVGISIDMRTAAAQTGNLVDAIGILLISPTYDIEVPSTTFGLYIENQYGGSDEAMGIFIDTQTTGKGIVSNADIAVIDDTKGIILKDDAGTPHYWRVTINSTGTLVTTDLGTSY